MFRMYQTSGVRGPTDLVSVVISRAYECMCHTCIVLQLNWSIFGSKLACHILILFSYIFVAFVCQTSYPVIHVDQIIRLVVYAPDHIGRITKFAE